MGRPPEQHIALRVAVDFRPASNRHRSSQRRRHLKSKISFEQTHFAETIRRINAIDADPALAGPTLPATKEPPIGVAGIDGIIDSAR
jgi:hypothetical protein